MALPGLLLSFKLFGHIWDMEWKVCVCRGIADVAASGERNCFQMCLGRNAIEM